MGAFGLIRLTAASPPSVINVRHLGRAVTRALGPWMRAREVQVFEEAPDAFGTAGTLIRLRDRLGPTVVTHNADLLTDLDPAVLLEAHAATGAPATLAVAEVDSGADLALDGGRPVRLVDRRVEPAAAGARFLGMAVFTSEALALLPDRVPLGLAEGLLAPLIERGEVAVHVHRGYAADVGTPARYIEASLALIAGAVAPPPPPRMLGVEARVGWPGEVIEVRGGRAYLGPGAVAERDSLGPGAIVLAGATLGPGAYVSRALIWPGERVSPGLMLEDCIYFKATPLRP